MSRVGKSHLGTESSTMHSRRRLGQLVTTMSCRRRHGHGVCSVPSPGMSSVRVGGYRGERALERRQMYMQTLNMTNPVCKRSNAQSRNKKEEAERQQRRRQAESGGSGSGSVAEKDDAEQELAKGLEKVRMFDMCAEYPGPAITNEDMDQYLRPADRTMLVSRTENGKGQMRLGLEEHSTVVHMSRKTRQDDGSRIITVTMLIRPMRRHVITHLQCGLGSPWPTQLAERTRQAGGLGLVPMWGPQARRGMGGDKGQVARGEGNCHGNDAGAGTRQSRQGAARGKAEGSRKEI